MNGMIVTIDKVGRITVPKKFRQRLGLRPNTELEIVEHPNGRFLRMPQSRPSLVRINGLLVHHGRLEEGLTWIVYWSPSAKSVFKTSFGAEEFKLKKFQQLAPDAFGS
jgi:AbrB family looped-hinge helix DNA binding protein